MTKSKSTRRPTCSKCHFHDKVDIAIKGHKQKCRYKNCNCEWCGLLKERQAILSQQTSCIRDARQQKEASEAGLASVMPFHVSGSSAPFNGFSSTSFGHDLPSNVPYPSVDAYTPYGSNHLKQPQHLLQPSAPSTYSTTGGPQGNNSPTYHYASSYPNSSTNNFTSTDFAKISSMCGNNTDSKKNMFHDDLKPYRQPTPNQQNSISELLYSPTSNSASSSPHSHPSSSPSCVSSESPSHFSGGFLLNTQLAEGPYCDRCRNHGEEVPLKGHKTSCPRRNCECYKCMLNVERKHVQTEIRHEKQHHELIGTSGYNMMSPISTYNGIPSQPTLPSAPYTPFYPTNTNQAAPLPDFTIPSYLNFRQSDITTCQKTALWESNKLSEIHYSSYYPQ